MKDLDLQSVIAWVITNKDDEKSMDVLSNLIFPFTSKYKNIYPNRRWDKGQEGYA